MKIMVAVIAVLLLPGATSVQQEPPAVLFGWLARGKEACGIVPTKSPALLNLLSEVEADQKGFLGYLEGQRKAFETEARIGKKGYCTQVEQILRELGGVE